MAAGGRAADDGLGRRGGRGFTDADATRRMYADFAGADLPDRYLVRGSPDPQDAAAEVRRRVDAGGLAWPAPSAAR